MSDTIQERLLAIARQRAEDRVVAEFGPAGGNPNAVPQDHIEWEAADEIDRLSAELDEKDNRIEELENGRFDGDSMMVEVEAVQGGPWPIERRRLLKRIAELQDAGTKSIVDLQRAEKRIEELERTHHSMEDDSGRQYAVIPVEWIDAAWKMGMEEHRLFGTRHILGVLEKLGIVACEKCGGTKRAHPPETRCSETECTCPNNGWVVRGKP